MTTSVEANRVPCGKGCNREFKVRDGRIPYHIDFEEGQQCPGSGRKVTTLELAKLKPC